MPENDPLTETVSPESVNLDVEAVETAQDDTPPPDGPPPAGGSGN